MRRRLTSPRLLLLVLVVTGVVGMHTLGHPGGTEHGSTERGVVLAGQEAMGSGADDAMTVALHVDAHGAGMVMNPLNVCLAVMVGGVLLLLAALLLRARRRAMPDRLLAFVRPQTGRGPPGRPPLGLHLADLSVQRI